MSENQIAHFPGGKIHHIVAQRGLTLCGKRIPPDSWLYNYKRENIVWCKDCLMNVGQEMLPDFMGLDFFSNTDDRCDELFSGNSSYLDSTPVHEAIKNIRKSITELSVGSDSKRTVQL